MKSFLEYVLVDEDAVVDEGIFTRRKEKPTGPTSEEREGARQRKNAAMIAKLHAARGTKPKKKSPDPRKDKGTPGSDRGPYPSRKYDTLTGPKGPQGQHKEDVENNEEIWRTPPEKWAKGKYTGKPRDKNKPEKPKKDDVLQYAVDQIRRKERRFDKAAERRAKTKRSFGPQKNPKHSTMASAFLKAKPRKK